MMALQGGRYDRPRRHSGSGDGARRPARSAAPACAETSWTTRREAQSADRVAKDHGLPVEATACRPSLIAAAAFLIEDAHGRDAMLTWLQGQCDGQKGVPGELTSKLN